MVSNVIRCCSNMFPENLVQACFQQIQTTYKAKKRKNATLQMTTTTPPGDYAQYQQESYYADYDQFEHELTTVVSRNLSTEQAWERSLVYADGINVLGECIRLLEREREDPRRTGRHDILRFVS